jgi:hypothetical protein
MIRSRSCFAASSALLFSLTCGSTVAAAQTAPVARPPAPARTMAPEPRPQQSQVRTVTESQDARQTRVELQELLRRYSPTLAGVFKLDPTLLTNSDYLAPYPGISEFLARHPEVARDPSYFFEDVELPWVESRRNEPSDPRSQVVNLWRGTMEGSMILIVFLVVTSTLIWLIKTLIDYRRWARLSKVQADVHNKVLDRFANNEDLLAYVQTPAGRRFLESAPISLDAATPAVAAPLRRILWAVEAGFVLGCGGIGVEIASRFVPGEIAPILFALGILGISLGAGFVIAAAASFFISKRLGLFQPPPPAQPEER